MNNKKVTIYDVAKRANTSLTTISRVLNDPEKVKVKTRNRILKIIDELGYHPNTVAQGLAKKRTKTIGVVISDLFHESAAELFNGICDIGRYYKYSIKVYPILYDKDVRDETGKIIADQVDGLIFANETLSERSINTFKEMILANKIPLVFANVSPQSEIISTVHIDHIKAIYDLCNEFVENGAKDIYFITSVAPCALNDYKIRGYQKSMQKSGFSEKIFKTSNDYLINKEHFKEYFSKNKIDVAICSSDEIAVSFINAMIEIGKKIPDDVEVAGCQNTMLSKFSRPTLTTIDLPSYDIGAVSMRMLTKLMDEGTENLKTVLNFSIIKRNSTKI